MMHDDQVDIDIDMPADDPRSVSQYQEDITSVRLRENQCHLPHWLEGTARFPLRTMNPTDCADMLRSEAAAMVEIAEHCYFRHPTDWAREPVLYQCHGH